MVRRDGGKTESNGGGVGGGLRQRSLRGRIDLNKSGLEYNNSDGMVH